MRRVILVDNGSRRADAYLNLRRLARQLSKKSGHRIDAVPLQHADRISAEVVDEVLGGKEVSTFPAYVEEALKSGLEELVIVPLFFGHSRAISSFIPATLESIQNTHGSFHWKVADTLSPSPQGEPRLARLLYENLKTLSSDSLEEFDFIVLVDHGSPSRKVAGVKARKAELLAPHLPNRVPLLQAVMERRDGPEYDFNGPLLEDLLEELARENEVVRVAISMLFISPGRHAGKGGDIAEICDRAMRRNPGLNVLVSPLVGDHPMLVDLLFDRVRVML